MMKIASSTSYKHLRCLKVTVNQHAAGVGEFVTRNLVLHIRDVRLRSSLYKNKLNFSTTTWQNIYLRCYHTRKSSLKSHLFQYRVLSFRKFDL